jgi:hypothetical protein
MKIADYKFTAYRIKTKEAALRQIDRVWEQNKDIMIARLLEKWNTDGRAPINRTVEGIKKYFQRDVLKNMSSAFGGENKVEQDINVNIAIERVLRSKLFQSKDRLFVTNMLAGFEGSAGFRTLQKADPRVTIGDIMQNADYIHNLSPMKSELKRDLDDVFDETYDKAILYTTPSGRHFAIILANSVMSQKVIEIK